VRGYDPVVTVPLANHLRQRPSVGDVIYFLDRREIHARGSVFTPKVLISVEKWEDCEE
jgi:hypothetical protein